MKKLRKNKFVVLITCVIIVSVVYYGAQKAIDNYAFKTNSDIVTEEDGASDSGDDEGSAAGKNTGESDESNSTESLEQFSDEEIDLVTEESETDGTVVDTELVTGTSTDNESDEKSFDENKIYVYITGEVNIPGVVILSEGSRIVDAINAAGGTTVKANVSKVNLVYVLQDGMKVNIPNDNDLKNNSDFEYITMSSGDGINDNYLSKSDYSESDGNSSMGSSSGSESGAYKGYSIVNINTATQTELETLPGIGPSLALKIISYRKENGKFSSIEEIKNVSGIGDSKFEEMKNYITI